MLLSGSVDQSASLFYTQGMPNYKLLSDEQLSTLASGAPLPDDRSEHLTAASLELLEFRRTYGPLGADWLSSEPAPRRPPVEATPENLDRWDRWLDKYPHLDLMLRATSSGEVVALGALVNLLALARVDVEGMVEEIYQEGVASVERELTALLDEGRWTRLWLSVQKATPAKVFEELAGQYLEMQEGLRLISAACAEWGFSGEPSAAVQLMSDRLEEIGGVVRDALDPSRAVGTELRTLAELCGVKVSR